MRLESEREARALIWLSIVSGQNLVHAKRMVSEAGDFVSLYEMSVKGEVPDCVIPFPKMRERFTSAGAGESAAQIYEKTVSSGMNIVGFHEPLFPDGLRYLPAGCPVMLYYYGDISILSDHGCCLAVVGSRRCSQSGEANAGYFSAELSKAGITVVSGLARGCDGAAHRGALRAGGKTAAVLACGADVVYPPEHKKLYTEIIRSGGCVLSESPPGTVPARQLFPARNRLIAGACAGTLVVEAAKRSGALITADRAIEADRIVMALPGDVRNPASYGCNELIRQGAVCVSDVGVVLEELGFSDRSKRHGKPSNGWLIGLPYPQNAVANAILNGAADQDGISAETGIDASEVGSALTLLELRGVVRRNDFGQYFLDRYA